MVPGVRAVFRMDRFGPVLEVFYPLHHVSGLVEQLAEHLANLLRGDMRELGDHALREIAGGDKQVASLR